MAKISVIMPVYNGEKYLREAIDSILNQTFTDFEFIIINDCSTDSTEDIIKAYTDNRIIYVKNDENMGVAESLNKGIDIAKGEYIARMDADDISLPQRFEKQVFILDNNSSVGICGSNIRIFGDKNQDYFYSEKNPDINVDLIFNPPFAHPAVMYRKSILIDNNFRYDVDYEKAEDYKLWCDILSVSEGYNIQELLLLYRHHNKQVTKTNVTEKNMAVDKIRRNMYINLGINNDELFNIFKDICNGKRCCNRNEYELFKKLYKNLILSDYPYKKCLKKNFSVINYGIYKNSNKISYKPILYRECLWYLKDLAKKLNFKIY